jgi:hypothetical protein
MTQPFLPQCTVHPGVAAATPCARCRRPYCAACLITRQGQPLCLACHHALTGTPPPALLEQRTDIRGTGRVELGRWVSAGWQLLLAEVGPWMLAALLSMVVSLATCLLTAPALSCGLFHMALRQISGRRIAADQVFWGFRRFGSAFVLSLLLGLPMVPVYAYVLYTLFSVWFVPKPDTELFMRVALTATAGYGFLFVYAMLITTVAFFAYPREAAVRVGPLGTLSQSWQVVRRNFWMFLLAAFVLMIIQSLGASVFYVGILFTLPLSVLAWAQAYVDHFGLEDAELD